MISRPTLIGVLVVVELAIVGAAFHALGGSGPSARSAWSFPATRVAQAAGAPGALDRTFTTGPAPHVTLNVEDLQVAVEAVPGAAVRVVESVHRSGWVSGTILPVRAERTPDGVRITVASGGSGFSIGSFERALRLTVPPGANVEIVSSSRVDATGLRAPLSVHASDGSIHVRDHRGTLDLQTNDGRIELIDVQGPSVLAQSRDGSLALTRVSADRLEARTEDGRITADAIRLVDGALTTHDGRVRVGYTPDSEATVDVHTGDGRITIPYDSTTGGQDGDAHHRTVRLGSGRGRFEVSSGDGSISITQGAQV
jgi:Putative adhesin